MVPLFFNLQLVTAANNRVRLKGILRREIGAVVFVDAAYGALEKILIVCVVRLHFVRLPGSQPGVVPLLYAGARGRARTGGPVALARMALLPTACAEGVDGVRGFESTSTFFTALRISISSVDVFRSCLIYGLSAPQEDPRLPPGYQPWGGKFVSIRVGVNIKRL